MKNIIFLFLVFILVSCSSSFNNKQTNKQILVCYTNGDKDTILVYDFNDLKAYNNNSIKIYTSNNVVGINSFHYTINNIRWYLFLDKKNNIEFHPLKK